MKIVGVLSYFNESPSWLAACVSSLARVSTHLVAVDGRYALYPDEMAQSPVEQAEAILQTATGAGLTLTLHRPTNPFYGNELEKRNLSFELARCVAEPMVDWLLVLDGDCYVSEHSDLLLLDLERTDQHCASFAVEEHMDPYNPTLPMNVARGQSLADAWRSPVTCLYRLLPDLRYEGTHYSISGLLEGRKVWLWGHDDALPPLNVSHALTVRHRNISRTERRREQAALYYAKRDALKTEVRPGR